MTGLSETCDKLIENDNRIISVVLLVLALHSWIRLWDLYKDMEEFIFQGLVVVPAISVAAAFFASIYLSTASAISFFASRPHARYYSLLPNLFSFVAAFFVYCFALMRPAAQPAAPLALCLTLILAGNALVLYAFVYLRTAFSVTAQVRRLVRTGPYAVVRHPMYLGNVLVLLGLSFMIGSIGSILVFFVASCLQVIRGVSEERLMAKWIPEYNDYQTRVGSFLPRKRILWFGVFLIFTASFVGVRSASANEILAPDSDLGRPKVVKNLCVSWHKKVLKDEWVTSDEGDQFFAVWGQTLSNLDADQIPACHDLFSLADHCQALAVWWGDDVPPGPSSSDIVGALDQIGGTPGCRSIVGLDELCNAFAILSKDRVKIEDKWNGVLSECLDDELRKSTGTFLRAGL